MVTRITERKQREREGRRARIVQAARVIAETEGWSRVTVRRLSEEIAYSQPVLYTHFENRDAIVAAVAVEGFAELGKALERARQSRAGKDVPRAVAAAYLEFAAMAPALYEAMFSMQLTVPFDEAATPGELRFAFAQVLALFPGSGARAEAQAEVFWASLHGVAELQRTGRLPPRRQKERLGALAEAFGSFAKSAGAQAEARASGKGRRL